MIVKRKHVYFFQLAKSPGANALALAKIFGLGNAVIAKLLRENSQILAALSEDIGVLTLSSDRRGYQAGILADENG